MRGVAPTDSVGAVLPQNTGQLPVAFRNFPTPTAGALLFVGGSFRRDIARQTTAGLQPVQSAPATFPATYTIVKPATLSIRPIE
jgi:hypothetical protein